MKKILLITATVLSFSFASQAADINAGRAKSASCVGCHGAKGISPSPMWPNLAGQQTKYLVKQLKDFKSGKRKDPTMGAMAKPLSDKDIENISAYFNSL